VEKNERLNGVLEHLRTRLTYERDEVVAIDDHYRETDFESDLKREDLADVIGRWGESDSPPRWVVWHHRWSWSKPRSPGQLALLLERTAAGEWIEHHSEVYDRIDLDDDGRHIDRLSLGELTGLVGWGTSIFVAGPRCEYTTWADAAWK